MSTLWNLSAGHDHFEVILGDGENDITYLLRDLLPKGFGPENIK